MAASAVTMNGNGDSQAEAADERRGERAEDADASEEGDDRADAAGDASGGAEADTIVRNTVRDRTIEPSDWHRLRHLLQETRAADLALERAHQHAARAKSLLQVFPASFERDALMALPDYVLARDR